MALVHQDLSAIRRQAPEAIIMEVVMPKMKTKKSAAKRFKVRGSGSIKRGQAFKRHILTKKTTKSKRQLRGSAAVHETNVASVRAMMPFA
ncbi:LSU ribosomal protein L35p [plant metagenome]|uniref:LSU ribosomal protein L35p n=1 Tax=plant metagenome TaxID=1297885 RepID=A0A484NWC0_9ZZZZ